jgi:WD40 repeat protein
VSFSPDGSRPATTAADGTVRIWALDLDQLVAIAERKVTRTLTDDECRRYLHTRPLRSTSTGRLIGNIRACE